MPIVLSSSVENQTDARVAVTVGAGAKVIWSLPVSTGEHGIVVYRVVGKMAGDSAQTVHFDRHAAFRNVAGTLTVYGEVALVPLQGSILAATATLAANGTTLELTVEGTAGRTINWVAEIEWVKS